MQLARFLGSRSTDTATGEDKVAVATQKQALNALVFFLREVEGKESGDFSDFAGARRRVRVPVVLSRAECDRLFNAMEGTPKLMAELVYGAGLRVMERLRLRVKDVDLERRQVLLRGGKGAKDRVTLLPEAVVERLRTHVERPRQLDQSDLPAAASSHRKRCGRPPSSVGATCL